MMKTRLCQIALVVVLSAIQAPETRGEKNKIKIIVPHKINYVHHHHHHHHPKQSDEKYNKKFHFVPHIVNHHHVHHEEESESEEEVNESPHFGSFELDHEEDTEGSHRGIAYYAIPASKLSSAAANLIMQPVLLYNEPFHKMKRHHPAYAFLRYGDYRGRHHPNHGPPPPPPPPPLLPPTDSDFDFK